MISDCMKHVPVLLNEVIDLLQLKPGMNVIDCTLGDGGHAEKILEKMAPNGRLLGIDADPESILRAKKFLYPLQDRILFVRDNFVHLVEIVKREKFGPVHGIVMDLGWSLQQMEERGRGFSFQKDEPLDMRYAPDGEIRNPKSEIRNLAAADLISDESEQQLARIFREYGEERLSRQIAEAIVKYRKRVKIETSKQLAEIVLAVYRRKLGSKQDVPWIGGMHPATKVFQALRIAVNDELGALEKTLPQAVSVLAPRGRLAVISFHSLEDRIVKHFFKSRKGAVHIVTKKPVTPSETEVTENPRARSAKLRVAEKLPI